MPDAPKKRSRTLSYDPGVVMGQVVPRRKPASKHPYNTQLDDGRNLMASSCKCFARPSKGACSGHFSEVHSKLFYAEAALEDAEKKIAALEEARTNLGQSTLRSEWHNRYFPIKNVSAEFNSALDAVIALRHPEKVWPRGEKK